MVIPNLYEVQEKAIFLVQIKKEEISKVREDLEKECDEIDEFLKNRIDLK